ncbi:MAG: sugar phosphate isomerase/epimerase, partial [Chitinophagaceae bacterium]|nr:sugar phosphate isomerase/epimerase [Chitinophagaceae bacterium]
AHETHRNKALFAAHIAAQLLNDNPEVRITADFSHWCVVSESLLKQQEEAVELASTRAIHIHARVGHTQSPQVSDPRAPEWSIELNTHISWWDKILAIRKKAGAPYFTITPEFGPAPYLPSFPYTKMTIVSQWDVNVYMMQLLKARYQGLNTE